MGIGCWGLGIGAAKNTKHVHYGESNNLHNPQCEFSVIGIGDWNREEHEGHEEYACWGNRTIFIIHQIYFRGCRGMKTPCVSLRRRDGRVANDRSEHYHA
ncbi:hypothetical protein SE18_07330 [Herpetosiphon geysericola]|uniref:Uncharacterized protein n=1 Tax=Herpetosiphon geysericola TaxID=70996 RepID=A0A0N8GSW2_9CHLR|nr:hypothetical protein SE18_07330 [Herpetosiphon geysericola]